MSKFAPDCYNSAATYCPEGVQIVQVGIILTAVFEILIGLLIMRIGKAALDRILPPIIAARWRWSSVWHWQTPRWETPQLGRA